MTRLKLKQDEAKKTLGLSDDDLTKLKELKAAEADSIDLHEALEREHKRVSKQTVSPRMGSNKSGASN